MNCFSTLILFLAVIFSSQLPMRAEAQMSKVTQVIENLLARQTYMRYGDEGLHYAEACAAMGAIRYADLTQNEDLLERLIARYEILLEPDTDLISSEQHVDFSVIGIIPLQIYLSNGRKDFLKLGLRFADRQWETPREDGLTRETRWWIDDIYMVGTLQIQAYRATGDPRYLDRCTDFLVSYLSKLQQPNGLFFHGPEAPFFWGRGNGWVAAGLAEVLKTTPVDHSNYQALLRAYRKMMAALLARQAPSGMWRQLIDYEEAWEESSCTAMFAYAMETGRQQGWLENDAGYRKAVDTAWCRLLELVDANGNLEGICVGTGQSQTPDYYLDRPKHIGDFHGQAPVLWLASARMNREMTAVSCSISCNFQE